MNVTEIFADIVGTHFRSSEAKEIVNQLEIGDEVSIEREPDNNYDPNAVAVIFKDTHIGYIPAAQNLELSLWLDEGNKIDKCVVIGFNGNKPTLHISWSGNA